MPPAFFLVMLAVAAGAILVSVRQRKEQDNDWARTAQRLGFRFSPGGWMGSSTMSGRLGDDRVAVKMETRGSGKHRYRVTVYRYAYHGGPRFRLQLRAQGLWHGVTRWFGVRDVEIGARGFDDAVYVEGDRARAIAAYLTPERCARIRSLLSSHRGSKITNTTVTVEHRGVDDGARIRRVVERLRAVADALRAPAAQALDRAMRERRGGRLVEVEEALAQARQQGAAEIEVEELALPRALAPPASGAAAATASTRRVGVPDPQAPEPVATPAAPPGAAPQPTEEPSEEPTPAASGAEATAAVALDQASVCAALFGPDRDRGEVDATFGRTFEGREVSWRGRLVRVEPYFYDRVFGDGGGTRAVVVVAQLAQGSLGYAEEVQAIVQLPEAAAAELEGRDGTELAFSGRLAACDGFMRNLYVADARPLPIP